MATSDEMRELVDRLRDDPGSPIRGFSAAVGERAPTPSCHLTLAARSIEIVDSALVLNQTVGADMCATYRLGDCSSTIELHSVAAVSGFAGPRLSAAAFAR